MKLEFLRPVIEYLPQIKVPERHIPFKEKLIWTSIALLIFFIMGQIYPYGSDPSQMPDQFKQIAIILASEMGSIVSLGIGPIVTASIILQLMVGAKFIDIDLTKPEDKALFQGTQKILVVFVSIFEASGVVFGMHLAGPGASLLSSIFIILQIALGSIVLMFLDELVSKWGVGSGIGLFIVGGVAREVITRSLIPIGETGFDLTKGLIPAFIVGLANGTYNLLTLYPIVATIVVFLVIVYFESMRLEIPISYGGIRGIGGRYPLKFFYVSNIPVILAVAVLMNISLWTSMVGVTETSLPQNPSLLQEIVYNIAHNITMNELHSILSPDRIMSGSFFSLQILLHLLIYMLFFLALCVLFGKFWVETTNMGAPQVAEQIHRYGMQIPGFRRDRRIIENVLNRYIPQITIISSIAVGLVAVVADLLGAIGSGTGLLLTIGILYRMYEEIQKEELGDMPESFRKIVGKE